MSKKAGPGLSLPLIYVVEDDAEVSKVVVHILRDFGFATEAFRDGASVLRRLQRREPDLCVIDLGLPDMDGIELVSKIRSSSSMGLLILTARGHTVDRVMGLELGADDYLVKSFEPRELVARVRSILRRRGRPSAQGATTRRYATFPGWRLDCTANALRAADGTEQLLGTAEAQLLRAFVERPQQILTREQLVGLNELSPLDRTIDVRISRLRRRIEANPLRPKFIKTVYGAGYMFTAAVVWS